MARLQTGSVRLASRLTGQDGQVGGSLEVGKYNDTIATDAYFKLPELTSTQRLALTAEEGMMVYDTTLDKEMVYRGSGWGGSDGTAAGSLDAAYNGGYAVTVDAGAVTLNDATTSTQGTLLITKSGAITGADSASVFHINSTGAHDTSGDVKMLEISVGTETISGSVYGIEIAMNANTDSGLEITKGAVVLTDGALTLTSGNLTMSSGNLDVTGTGAISGNATVGGTLGITGATTCAALTASGDVIIDGTGKSLIIDSDDAEAFLIRTNGDAADVVTVDTTGDAGDTTMLITPENTTGVGVHIDGSSITSGDALKVTVAAATMTAAGAAISVVADGTEVFAVRDDGSIYTKSTAEGTTGFQIVTGDMLVSDGDFTVAGGESSFTDGITTAGIGMTITSTATTAGVGAGTAGPVVITANSLTTGTALVVRADAITTGDMLFLDAGGATMTAGSGFFINCNDDNTSKFTVSSDGRTVIAGTAAGTAALTLTLGDLVVTDSDGSTMSSVNGTTTLLTLDNAGGVIASDAAVLSIDAGGAVASGGNLLRIAPTGSPNAGAIGIEYVGASKAMTAMYIDGDPTASHLVQINGGGAMTSDIAALCVSTDGAIATGGNAFRVDVTGTPASGAIYAELDYAGITDTNENIGFKIDAGGKKVQALYVDADPIAGDVAYIHSDAVIADNKAVLQVHSAGAVASGGNAFRVEVDGTPASGAIYGEFDFTGITDTNENIGVKIDAGGKKVVGLHVDADPIANSAVYLTSGAALAADKATLEVVSVPTTNNADSAVVRLEQTHTAGGSNMLHMVQNDVDKPFFGFETTVGEGNALEAVGAKSLTVTHFVMVDIEGVGARYLQVGTIA